MIDAAHPLDSALRVPHDLDAERAVLAAALVDAGALAAARAVLQADDFFRELHGLVWGAIERLTNAGSTVDTVTVAAELARLGQLDVIGGPAYLAGLTSDLATVEGVESWARLVREAADKRRLISAAGRIAQLGFNGVTAEAAYAQAQQMLEGLRPKDAAPPPEQTFRALDLFRAPGSPIRHIVGGILPEGVTILGGRPKQGKSFLALALAIAVAAGVPALGDLPVEQGEVLYLSLEGGRQGLAARLRAMLPGSEPPAALYCATEWAVLNQGGADDIERFLTAHPATRLLIVDTLQRVRPATNSRQSAYEQDYEALRRLIDLAQRLRIAILVLHHTRKSGGDDIFDTISGTLGLTGSVDSSWVLQRVRGQDNAVLAVTGRNVEEQEIGLQWDRDTLTWKHSGTGADAKRTTERRMILDAMMQDGGGPLTARNVADLLESDYESVRKMMWRMERSGELIKETRGYVIPL